MALSWLPVVSPLPPPLPLSPEPRLESCSGEFFPGDPGFSLFDSSDLVVFGLLSKNLCMLSL